MVFNSGYFQNGLVVQWTESASSARVEHYLAVSGANDWHHLNVNGVFVDNYMSNDSGQISFSQTVGSDQRIFSIAKGQITGPALGPVPKTYPDSIIINQDAEYTTTRQVQLSFRADNTSQMAICNNLYFTACPLESYQETKTWLLPEGEGRQTVYALFVSPAGNRSPIIFR